MIKANNLTMKYDDNVVAETTIKTHLGRILAKLELCDRVQAFVFAHQNGLIERI